MVLSIVMLSINLGVDSPVLDPNSAKKRVLNGIYCFVTAIFLIELILKSLAYGLLFSPDSFLRQSIWNVLSFITTIASILFVINPWERRIYILKYFVILRISLLLLYFETYVKEIRFAGKMMF